MLPSPVFWLSMEGPGKGHAHSPCPLGFPGSTVSGQESVTYLVASSLLKLKDTLLCFHSAWKSICSHVATYSVTLQTQSPSLQMPRVSRAGLGQHLWLEPSAHLFPSILVTPVMLYDESVLVHESGLVLAAGRHVNPC